MSWQPTSVPLSAASLLAKAAKQPDAKGSLFKPSLVQDFISALYWFACFSPDERLMILTAAAADLAASSKGCLEEGGGQAAAVLVGEASNEE